MAAGDRRPGGGYLNAQRAANGLPEVVESHSLDEDCESVVGHRPESSSASPAGAFQGGIKGGAVGRWNMSANPFGDDPRLLEVLYHPLVDEYGYAETRSDWGIGEACVNVSGQTPSAGAPAPSFYSVPGSGASAVRFREIPGESETQGAPEKEFGLPGAQDTGPNIVLWVEGTPATLEHVELTGPGGPQSLVSRAEPDALLNALTHGATYYLVAPQPLAPATAYTLSAAWRTEAGASFTQDVSFRTRPAEPADGFVCEDCLHGQLSATIRAGIVHVSLSPAVGQTVTVSAGLATSICILGTGPRCRVCHDGKCHRGELKYEFAPQTIVTHTIRHFRHSVAIRLPRPTQALRVLGVTVNATRFTSGGFQWASPNSLCVPICTP